MAITRKIVEDHGGRIDFTSALGLGSAFTIALPMEPADR
jgi:signal transduction histidine kinase